MMYHIFNRFLKKTYNLPLKFRYFYFSLSSSSFLTVSWLPIFVSAEPSWTISSTDRSEPRFKIIQGENKENFKKWWKFWCFLKFFGKMIFKILPSRSRICKTGYLAFNWKKSRSRTWKTGYLAFKWKKKNYFCQTLTDDARHENVPLPLELTRILKTYHKRNNRRKLSEK